MTSEHGDVHMFTVIPKKRTRETIALLVTLAALLLLLFLLIGHPATGRAPYHPRSSSPHETSNPH